MSNPKLDDDVVEIELDLEAIDEVPAVVDEIVPEPRPRQYRWTPALGVSTKPAITVGVMLGRKKTES